MLLDKESVAFRHFTVLAYFLAISRAIAKSYRFCTLLHCTYEHRPRAAMRCGAAAAGPRLWCGARGRGAMVAKKARANGWLPPRGAWCPRCRYAARRGAAMLCHVKIGGLSGVKAVPNAAACAAAQKVKENGKTRKWEWPVARQLSAWYSPNLRLFLAVSLVSLWGTKDTAIHRCS